MNCPICGQRSHVKDVRDRKSEAKSRQRVCLKGHTFRSYEISEERYQELLDLELLVVKMHRLLKTYDE
jgi:hypothetical protein